MPERFGAAEIGSLASAAGVAAFRLVSVERLIGRLDRVDWFPHARTGSVQVLPALAASVPDPLSGSILACAFPYACDRPEDAGEPPPPGSAGLVSPFARRNYYRAAVNTLRGIARVAGEAAGAPAASFRIFVNSRVPEKLIACGAGLGRYGKNRLLFTDAYGSRFVIGLLFIPRRIDDDGGGDHPESPDEWCGACAACRDACPVDALRPGAGLSACLKARSDALDPWDDFTRRAWGVRLYGCDACQAACPRNRRSPQTGTENGETRPGDVGPEIDLAAFLSLTEDGIRARFKKTALGMSWIHPRALLRNALCAAGNSGARALLPAVTRYRDDPRPLLADTARWAMARIGTVSRSAPGT